jgi:hypothetical protein
VAFTTVTITRDYDLADGTDPTGTVTFTPTMPGTDFDWARRPVNTLPDLGPYELQG